MTVNKHIDLLSIKLHDSQRHQSPRTNPTSTIPSSAPDSSFADGVIAKAKVKFTTLHTLALTAKQDAEEDGIYLETATDDKISRLVNKISKYEKLKEKISNSHSEW